MMDEDAYRDYLVDTAKDLLEEMEDGPEQTVEPDDTLQPDTPSPDTVGSAGEPGGDPGVDAVDRHEPDFLARNRASMSNDELEEFLAGNSPFHEALTEEDAFTRWEKRFLIQHHDTLSVDELAEQLDRDREAVRAGLRLLGLDG